MIETSSTIQKKMGDVRIEGIVNAAKEKVKFLHKCT